MWRLILAKLLLVMMVVPGFAQTATPTPTATSTPTPTITPTMIPPPAHLPQDLFSAASIWNSTEHRWYYFDGDVLCASDVYMATAHVGGVTMPWDYFFNRIYVNGAEVDSVSANFVDSASIAVTVVGNEITWTYTGDAGGGGGMAAIQGISPVSASVQGGTYVIELLPTTTPTVTPTPTPFEVSGDRGPGTWSQGNSSFEVAFIFPAKDVERISVNGLVWPDHLVEYDLNAVDPTKKDGFTIRRTSDQAARMSRDHVVNWLYTTCGPFPDEVLWPEGDPVLWPDGSKIYWERN